MKFIHTQKYINIKAAKSTPKCMFSKSILTQFMLNIVFHNKLMRDKDVGGSGGASPPALGRGGEHDREHALSRREKNKKIKKGKKRKEQSEHKLMNRIRGIRNVLRLVPKIS